MSKYSARPLQILESIYRFVGGQRSSSSVDLASPVTLVHDVGRQAERATGFFAIRETDQLALLGTTDRTTLTRASIFTGASVALAGKLRDLGLDSRAAVWLMQLTATLDPTSVNITQAAAGLTQGGTLALNTESQLVYLANQGFGSQLIAAQDFNLCYRDGAGVDHAPQDVPQLKLPQLLADAAGTALVILTTASGGGACQIRWSELLWIGPTGATPPGLL